VWAENVENLFFAVCADFENFNPTA